MLFRSYIPPLPLSEFIEDFWLYEDYAGTHERERILPGGTFEMVFNLREDELRIYSASDLHQYRRFSGAVISGPYAGCFISDTTEEAAVMGVHFRPGGAFAFLGMPAGELINRHVDLSAVWGRSAATLRERLAEPGEPAARFRLLEQALMARLAEPADHHDAVRAGLRMLRRSHGQARIADVAGAVNLSPRRFTDLFTAGIGMPPKLFARVQRFQHAAALSRRATTVDWAQLALECGYYDQPHLINEFVEFAGLSPADYRQRLKAFEAAGTHVKRHHLPLEADFGFFQSTAVLGR